MTGVLARGPWEPSQITVTWRHEPFEVPAAVTARADAALQRLRDRGSPSHDGLAGRLRAFRAEPGGALALECEPIRWSLRLLERDAMQSLSALCLVRDAEGCWLAGRRAGWLATWAHRWALGAAGSVEVDEHPTDTLLRELREEWSVEPQRLTIEALVKLPSGLVSLIGMAWLAEGTAPVPDSEHDEFAWWPPDPAGWPEEADEPLRLIPAMLAAG